MYSYVGGCSASALARQLLMSSPNGRFMGREHLQNSDMNRGHEPEHGHPGRSSSDADQASDEYAHPTAANPLRPGWPRSENRFMESLDLQSSDVHRDHEPEMPKS